jgi:hypothetical protein
MREIKTDEMIFHPLLRVCGVSVVNCLYANLASFDLTFYGGVRSRLMLNA